jgi:hypothetical protein
MWIVPSSMQSAFVLESGCSMKALEPDSNSLDMTSIPLPMLNGKVLQPASFLRSWKRDAWMKRLCGAAICETSTRASFEAWWISSLRASRAKTSASPAGALVSTASARGSSSTSSTSQTLAVRVGLFWRTSQASLVPEPPLWTRKKESSKSAQQPASWGSWPTAGGMRNGSLFLRPTLEPATGGFDGSALPGEWPTPDAAMHQGANTSPGPAGSRPNIALASRLWTTPDVCSGARDMSKIDPEAQKRPDTKRTTGLPTEAAMWLTPNVPNGGRSVSAELVASHGMTATGEKKTVGLESQTKHWLTPCGMTGMDHTGKLGSGGEFAKLVSNWVAPQEWPTPASRDYRTPNSQESQESRKHTGGEQLPNFVEHHFLPLAPLIPSGATFSVPVVSAHGAELSPTTRPAHVLGRLRLNPAFGCWLMGWPSWWTNPGLTNSVRSEMASYRFALQSQLSSLCGAQD